MQSICRVWSCLSCLAILIAILTLVHRGVEQNNIDLWLASRLDARSARIWSKDNDHDKVGMGSSSGHHQVIMSST